MNALPHTGKIRIRRRLQRTQSRPNNEGSAAESTERLIQSGGPHAQSANAVEDESEDEDRFVAVVAQDPIGIT